MAEQSITIPASGFTNGITGGSRSEFARWTASPAVEIDSDLDDPVATVKPYFYYLHISNHATGSFDLNLGSSALLSSRADLSTEFETNGSVEIQVGSNSIIFEMNGTDTDEPYRLSGYQSEVIEFFTAIGLDSDSDLDGTIAATIIIRDFVPAATPDASAGTASVAINAITAGNEGTNVTLGATVTKGTGVYDTVSYAWTAVEGTLTGADTATPTWTRPTVTATKNVQIGLTVTLQGDGTTAKDGTSVALSQVTRNASVVDVPPALPVAVAPTVSIDSVAAGDEGTTVTLGATIAGGTYDGAITYAWSVDEGTLNDATAAAPVWTRPAVTATKNVDINLRITVSGTGTNARSGTSASRDATEISTSVRNVVALPNASAGTASVSIDTISAGSENTLVTLGATITKGTGVYDSVSYAWSVDEGALNDATLAAPTWTRPLVSSDTDVTVRLVLTLNGGGTTAASGSSVALAEVTTTTTVNNVVALPDATAPSVTINSIVAGDEGTSVVLSVSVTGGAYDSLTYLWTTNTGVIQNATVATPTWWRGSANATIGLTVTALGTGSAARNGSSAQVVATSVSATVNTVPVPDGAWEINLPAGWYDVNSFRKAWTGPAGIRPQAPARLATEGDTYFESIAYRLDRFGLVLHFVDDRDVSPFTAANNIDLSSAFETGGRIRIEADVGGVTRAFQIDASEITADTTEPYRWDFPAGRQSEFTRFRGVLSNSNDNQVGKLILSDGATTLPDASAGNASVSINAISAGNEGTNVTLGASVTKGTGVYDTVSYAWTADEGTLTGANTATPTWTRPTVSATKNVTLRLVVTLSGDGTTATSGTSVSLSEVTRDASVVDVPPALPAASAGNASVSIDTISAGDEDTTVTLGASITKGTGVYDSVTYAWSVDEGTLNNAASATPVWTRPTVTSTKNVTVRLVLTLNGTGTTARNGTSVALTEVTRAASVVDVPAVSGRQIIPLLATWYDAESFGFRWRATPISSRPQIDASLAPTGEDRYLEDIVIRRDTTNGRRCVLNIAEDNTSAFTQSPAEALSDTFASGGSITIEFSNGGNDYTFTFRSTDTSPADTTEPYIWRVPTADNTAYDTFLAAFPTTDNSIAGRLILDDGSGGVTLPDASAGNAAVAINAITAGNEGTQVNLGATLTKGTGVYDDVAYAWTADEGTLTGANTATPTWTRPAVTATKNVTIRLVVTLSGDGTTAKNGTSVSLAEVTRAASVVDVPVVLPNAVAPAVSIDSVASGDEGTTVTLGATITGGTYDGAVTYAWSVDEGTLNDATVAAPVWTRPSVTATKNVGINLRITVNGTGTNARTGTTANRDAQEITASVQNVLPNASAGTAAVSINTIDAGNENTHATLGATITKGTGVYDSVSYAWSVDEGTLNNATVAAPTWRRPSVSADKDVTVRLVLTLHGGGATADAGSSVALAEVTRDATVNNVEFDNRPLLITDTGAGTWTVPDGVTSVVVQLVGGGGGGGSDGNASGGGGGGTTWGTGASQRRAGGGGGGSDGGGTGGSGGVGGVGGGGRGEGQTFAAANGTGSGGGGGGFTVIGNGGPDGGGGGGAFSAFSQSTAGTGANRGGRNFGGGGAGDTTTGRNGTTGFNVRRGGSGGNSGAHPITELAGYGDGGDGAYNRGSTGGGGGGGGGYTSFKVDVTAGTDIAYFVAGAGGGGQHSVIPGSDGEDGAIRLSFIEEASAGSTSVSIDAVAAGNEETEVALSATITKGTGIYDFVTYAWAVDEGTLDDAGAAAPVWTRPLVTATKNVTIRLVVTLSGDGTTALLDSTVVLAEVTRDASVINIPPVRLQAELTADGFSTSMLSVVEPPAIRLAAELEAMGFSSSMLSVTEPPAVRLAAELAAEGFSSSMLSVTEPDAVRLAAELSAMGFSSSMLSVTEPAATRLGAELTAEGFSSSGLSVTKPGAVRLTAELSAEGFSSSQLDVLEPPAIRLESELSATGFSSSMLSITEPAAVRLAAELAAEGFSSSRLSVTSPGAVRIAAELEAEGFSSSALSITSPGATRLAAELAAEGFSSSMLSVTSPGATRLAAELAAEGFSSSMLAVTKPGAVRVQAELAAMGFSSSMLSIAEPPPVRVASELSARGFSSSELTIDGPESLRLSAELSAVGFGTSDVNVQPPNMATFRIASKGTTWVEFEPVIVVPRAIARDVNSPGSITRFAVRSSQIRFETSRWNDDAEDIYELRIINPSESNRVMAIAQGFGGRWRSTGQYRINTSGALIHGTYLELHTDLNALDIGHEILVRWVPPPPIRLQIELKSSGFAASGLSISEPPDVRLSAELEAVGFSSSQLNVVEPPAIRLEAELEAEGFSSSELSITPPSPTRLAAELSADGFSSSMLSVAPPGPVRLQSELSATGFGSSLLTITEPNAVRIASELSAIGFSSSELSITPPGPTRLQAELTAGGFSSSMVSVVPPGPVRLTSELSATGFSSATLSVLKPGAVRLESELTADGFSSSMLSITEPPAVRLQSNLSATGSSSSMLSVDGPGPVRLMGELTAIGFSSSMITIVDPPAVRLEAELGATGFSSSMIDVAPPGATRLLTELTAIGFGSTILTVEGPIPLRLRAELTARGFSSSNVSILRGELPDLETTVARDARSLTGRETVYAIEIAHAALLRPARVVADTVNHSIEGNTYIPVAFEVEAPNESDGEVREISLRIDNIGEELMQWVRASQGGRGAEMRVMNIIPPIISDETSAINWEVSMGVRISEATNESVNITISDELGASRPGIKMRHDPVTSPGIF